MASPSSSSSRSWKYDVFLSFRGEDTRKTFVDHLYSALQQHGIHTYKDDETLDRGDTIAPSLMKAIETSQILVIVFSENYADSSWCLDELSHIMKCKDRKTGQTVYPIFYHVDPSDVRKQKGQFGKAFAKHNNNNKVESWQKALVDVSSIAGWEPNQVANGHEAKCIQEIVGSILDKLSSLDSAVEVEDLVGMGTRLKDLKQLLRIGSGGVRMVGIWGIGGGGKTTLATSIYMELKISRQFHGCCFVGNIKEESKRQNGLKSLQEKILSTIFDKKMEVESVVIGKHMIKNMLSRRNVLIVLDDVDHLDQLEALAGRHDWFGDGSRIIITTRNEQMLISHRVDEVYPVSLLSDDEAIWLFKKHAYHENNPVKDYEKLSLRVISYVNGLPLALKILGSFLYGKDKNEWLGTLARLKDLPEMNILEKLKVSYDGLQPMEKELFLDIACFFRRQMKDDAMKILDACGFHTRIGVKVLIQKALITISKDGRFDMHDLVQEMGHFIVRGEHPNNPEKHSRVWRYEDIEDICSKNVTTENDKIEAIQNQDDGYSFNITFVSNMKNLRFLKVSSPFEILDEERPRFLSFLFERLGYYCNLTKCLPNVHMCGGSPKRTKQSKTYGMELRYLDWYRYPASLFPESFQPMKLVVLIMNCSLQKELWKGNKYLPCLKELELSEMEALMRTPDFGGLPCLQKLIIHYCNSLEEIHPSLGNHSSLVSVDVYGCKKLKRFPRIVGIEKLEILQISECKALVEFPEIEAKMDNLVELSLYEVGIEVLPSSVGEYCTNLISLRLEGCSELKSIEGNFHALKGLKNFELNDCKQLEKLPKDHLFNENLDELGLFLKLVSSRIKRPILSHLPRSLRKLNLEGCGLKDGDIPSEIGELSNLQELHLGRNDFTRLDFSLSQLTHLKLLNLDRCSNLVELPELPSSLANLGAAGCWSLEGIIRDEIHRNCKWLSKVTLWGWGRKKKNMIGGDRLLETMLQGNVVKSGCMMLQVQGLEIARGFEPRLVRGRRCRMQLPDNWCNDFSGFLICAVSKKGYLRGTITMKHVEKLEGNSQHVVYWEESDYDVITLVWYVSFGLLRNTLWWDPTSTSIQMEIESNYPDGDVIGGCGIKLVQMGTITTPHSSSEISLDDDNDYKYKLDIEHDSKSAFKFSFC